METLAEIRESFIEDCTRFRKLSRAYQTIVKVLPNDQQPEFKNILISMGIYKEISETSNAVATMLHSQLILEWHLFLEKIFERRLYEILQGNKPEKLKKTVNVNLQLKLPDDMGVDLLEIVLMRSVEKFSNEGYKERLNKVLAIVWDDAQKIRSLRDS